MNDLEVELWLRRHTPACTASAEQRLIHRVDALEGTSQVASVRVETWDRVRPHSPRCPDELETVRRFARWADRNGLSLEPAFQRRSAGSLLEESEHVEIVVPLACLAVYDDGELRCVTPCSNGDRVATVDQALTRLKRGDVSPGLEPGAADERNLADLTV